MRVGFTGTQRGMERRQHGAVAELLRRRLSPPHMSVKIEAHHGDCVGADEEFHHLVRELSDRLLLGDSRIVVHPPEISRKRAFCQGDEERVVKNYLARNYDIVEDTDLLIAAPGTSEILCSGTWATIRHARKLRKTILRIMPNGTEIKEVHL